MATSTRHGGWVILVSVFLALILSVVPMPTSLELVRPPWTLVVIIYWVLALPERVGVGVAWGGGLFVDILQSMPLGAHALGFALVAWLTLKLHRRLRIFPMWQQAMTVLVLSLLVRVLLFWVDGITGRANPGWWHWMPAFSATVVWPVVFFTLREARRRFNVR
ncbi:Rod shape-determining protein MreD [wastewater metagenome]|uniref:Rod shape-determining protein MreD n=2 Tax=unclassified sequences TaxID=12908 RepID=A0A5B8R5U4_9ZZZZ|nr:MULTISPECIES: rod shape-determining protein MreD [Arhodomonas]MCS4505524.1 rod shape-determining protein MreD [Arhodomonas aquaeolei]QEA03891.1 rod shape-determining protein MreD [uncultured organism]